VIAAVRMALTRRPFFFHVRDFAIRRKLAVPARDAAAGESREAEESNEAAHSDSLSSRLSNKHALPDASQTS
jgi:hypothetical protein